MYHSHGPTMYVTASVALAVMIVTFVAVTLLGKKYKQNIPIAITLFVSMFMGALCTGFLLPISDFIRNLFEGQVWYIYINLVILTGMIFLTGMKEAGNLDNIAHDILTAFHKQPIILFILVTALLFFPGMFTGVGTAAVLSTGIVAVAILRVVGIPDVRIAAIVALVTTMGAAAPPVNLPALIIASGINMPYEGFTWILLVTTVPLGLFSIFWLGWRPYKAPTQEQIDAAVPNPARKGAVVPYLPLIVVITIFALIRIFPGKFPDIVTPMVFMIGALTTLFTGKRYNFIKASKEAVSGGIFSTVALLFVIGCVVQVTTWTGVKGLLVLGALTLGGVSTWVMYLAMGLSMPLMGGVLTHLGTAVILGIPFTLALLGHNTIVVCAAASLMCVLSQIMPPSALGGYFAQAQVGLPTYGPVLRKCMVPMLVCIALAIVMLAFSNQFAAWFVPF